MKANWNLFHSCFGSKMPQDLASKYIQTAVHIPQRVLAKLLKASGAPESEAFCRKRLHDEIDACAEQTTPYGKVLQCKHLALQDGGTTDWWHVNPFAFFWLLCDRSPRFATLWRDVMNLARVCASWLCTRMKRLPATSLDRTMQGNCSRSTMLG